MGGGDKGGPGWAGDLAIGIDGQKQVTGGQVRQRSRVGDERAGHAVKAEAVLRQARGKGRAEPARQPDAGRIEPAHKGGKDGAGAVTGGGGVVQPPEGGKAARASGRGGFKCKEAADERVT